MIHVRISHNLVIRHQCLHQAAWNWLLTRPLSITHSVKYIGLWLWNVVGSFLIDGVVNFSIRHDLNHISVLRRYDAYVVVSGETNASHQTVSASKAQPRLTTHTHNVFVLMTDLPGLAATTFSGASIPVGQVPQYL